MSNNIFPELDEWDEIISKAPNKDALSLIKITHKLVLSLANLRSAVSSQVGYLKNKVENLQQSVDRLSDTLQKSIDDFNDASSKLYKANIWLTAIIAYATLMNVIISLGLGRNTTVIITIVAIILFLCIVFYLLKK